MIVVGAALTPLIQFGRGRPFHRTGLLNATGPRGVSATLSSIGEVSTAFRSKSDV
jgi:hypothetical protein